MKYCSKITLGLIFCTGLFASCQDDDEKGISGGLTVDKEEITVGAEGGNEKIEVSSGVNWVASASRPWITISPANGDGPAECILIMDSTLENTARTAQVRFNIDNGEPKIVTITQFGYGKQIILKEPEVEIENSAAYDKRNFNAVISSNVYFKIDKIDYSFEGTENMTEEEMAEIETEKEGWLTQPKDTELEKLNLDRKARPRTISARFTWEMNTTPCIRVAKIYLKPINQEDQQELVDNEGNHVENVVLTVKQKAALKITDDRTGDSLAIVTINEKIQSMILFETSENMRNWENATLWEATDENLPSEDAVGRVRAVYFMMFDLKNEEVFPKEIRHLKYLETFSVQSNVNHQTRTVKLCPEICDLKYLRHLNIYAYGLTELPDGFVKLGGSAKYGNGSKGLSTLGLASGCFAKLTDIIGDNNNEDGNKINAEDFPNLRELDLTGCRRTDILKDLTKIEAGDNYNGNKIGLHFNMPDESAEKDAFLRLLAWDKLTKLSLSYNFIEGKLPTDDEVSSYLEKENRMTTYQSEDFIEKTQLDSDPSQYLNKISKDTCDWLLGNDNAITFKQKDGSELSVRGQDVPRVLPFTRSFSINLNFMTGDLPKWVLFHPYFVEWGPEIFIFNQQEEGKDRNGNNVGFGNIDNVKFDYTYYYGKGDEENVTGVAYPLYYKRYVAN